MTNGKIEDDEVLKYIEETKRYFLTRDFGTVVSRLEHGEKLFPRNKHFLFSKTALLVDTGKEKPDLKILKQGVDLGKTILHLYDKDPNIFTLLVNIANGYHGLYGISKPREAYTDERAYIEHITTKENTNYIREAKLYYKAAAYYEDPIFERGRLKFWVNYGVLLDGIGQVIEANRCYDRALTIEEDFPMAHIRKGLLLKRFSFLSGGHFFEFLTEAFIFLQKGLRNENRVLEETSELGLQAFKREFEDLTDIINNLPLIDRPKKENLIEPENGFEEYYINRCLEEDIFLNVSLADRNNPVSRMDVIALPGKLPGKDEEEIALLNDIFEDLVETYTNARLNYVTSEYGAPYNFITKSSKTVGPNGFKYGALKNAFALAFNVLDKIAGFLIEHFGLDFEKKNRVFVQPKLWEIKSRLRPEFLPFENRKPNLAWFALYNIYKDFRDKANYWEIFVLKELRDAITHHHLSISPEEKIRYDIKRKTIVGVPESTFRRATLDLFRIVKSAIIYVANGIRLEAQTKYENGRWFIRPDLEA